MNSNFCFISWKRYYSDLVDLEVFNIRPVHFEHGLFENPNLKTGFELFIAENEEEFNNYCKQEYRD